MITVRVHVQLDIPQRWTIRQLRIQPLRQVRHPHRHKNALSEFELLVRFLTSLLGELLKSAIADLKRGFDAVGSRCSIRLERREEVSMIEHVVIVPVQSRGGREKRVKKIRSHSESIQHKQPCEGVAIKGISVECCSLEYFLLDPRAQSSIDERDKIIGVGRNTGHGGRWTGGADGWLHIAVARGAVR